MHDTTTPIRTRTAPLTARGAPKTSLALLQELLDSGITGATFAERFRAQDHPLLIQIAVMEGGEGFAPLAHASAIQPWYADRHLECASHATLLEELLDHGVTGADFLPWYLRQNIHPKDVLARKLAKAQLESTGGFRPVRYMAGLVLSPATHP